MSGCLEADHGEWDASADQKHGLLLAATLLSWWHRPSPKRIFAPLARLGTMQGGIQEPTALEEGKRSTPSSFSKPESSPHEPDPEHNVAEAVADHRSTSDAASIASVDRPPSADEVSPGHAVKVYAPLSVPVLAFLIPFSIFGVLARLGIEAIATYDGQAIFTLAWVQAFGCLFMGIFLELKQPIGDFYGPLYTGLTTGFCGSLTTFSSWQVDVFLSWANTTGDHRDWFRDVIDGLAKTLATLAIAVSCIQFGAQLAKPIARSLPRRIPPASGIVRGGLPVVSVLMYAATLPAYFLMSPAFRHKATAALLFAFPGTLLRYLLSLSLNPRTKFMPLGTFTANVVGTALLGTFHILQRAHTPSLPSPTACALLQGLSDGLCGCLTTVSTFAVELTVLEGHIATRYAAISWTTSQLFLLVIMGSSWWAGNVKDSVQCSFAN